MATGGDRAGPEHSSPGGTTPAPASDPQAGSPSCRAGLAPFGGAASSSPSPRPPNHWDPGLAKGRSGGAAMAGDAPDWTTEAWQGRDAVARGAGAPCCCPYRDSGLREAAESPRRRRCLCCNSGRAVAAAGRFGSSFSPSSSSGAPGRPPACAPPLLQRLLAVPAPLRYSQACYYAGENGLLGPRPPQCTSAPGLLMAGSD